MAALIATAGSQYSAEFFEWPLFACCVALAFAINWLVFIPSYKFQTEHYYDLTGSLTYLSVIMFAVLYSPKLDLRTTLITLFIGVWAMRLGSFLFLRIKKVGSDSRFDAIKPDTLRFLLAWTLQALWVSLTAGAGIAAIASSERQPLEWVGLIGIAVWIFGFAIEVISDRQKNAHRAKHPDGNHFIQSGLWAWSRHPNYFGEILLWLGIALIALPVLRGWQYATLISPVFVYFLLTKVSGIPMLEDKSDQKWGNREDYHDYKNRTPVLFPRKPGSN